MSAADELALALAAIDGKNREAAADHIKALVRRPPGGGRDWLKVARVADRICEEAAALTAARHHVADNPDDLLRHMGLAHLLLNYGHAEEALRFGQSLAAKFPDAINPHQFLGIAFAQLGEADAAIEALERSLQLRPLAPESWQTMSLVKKFTRADIARMTALEPQLQQLSPERQASLYYALGKAWDDVGEPEQAFRSFQRGAAGVAGARAYDAAADKAFVDAVCRDFDDAYLRRQTPNELPSQRAIFVIGLPRSGTTLMEQILSAHSSVSGGGELNFLQFATFETPEHTPKAIDAALAQVPWSENPWRRFGRTLAYFFDERFGDAPRIVDKSISNSRSAGMLKLMAPDARIIWMRRDPADTALSCFKNRFKRGNDWSFSLPTIAAHFRQEDRLHAHWSALLGDTILTVPYESLVAEPDVWIRRALAHCGLSDEPATREFHLQKRAVQTASLAQVRRPMNAGSVGAWRKYGDAMQPFLDAYAKH